MKGYDIMKFHSEKVKPIEVNGTMRNATVRDLIGSFDRELMHLPITQRKVKSKSSAAYKKHSRSFAAYLLVQTFCVKNDVSELEDILKPVFGNHIEVTSQLPQLFGFTVDENNKLECQEGQHRFKNELREFFEGRWGIPFDMKFEDATVSDGMKQIFKAVELEDGDGTAPKELFITAFSDEDIERMLDFKVTAAVIKSDDAKKRGSLFVSMNTCFSMKNSDISHTLFAHTNMWQTMESVHERLHSSKRKYGVDLGFKQYNAADANILHALLVHKTSFETFLPIVAHMGLLSLLPKPAIKHCQWIDDNQTKHTRDFLEVTDHWSKEKCEEYMKKVCDRVILVGKKLYNNNVEMMKNNVKARSLLVGQVHAVSMYQQNNIPAKKFYDVARAITRAILSDNGYVFNNDKHDYAYFNNTHQDREKNELFFHMVKVQYEHLERMVA